MKCDDAGVRHKRCLWFQMHSKSVLHTPAAAGPLFVFPCEWTDPPFSGYIDGKKFPVRGEHLLIVLNSILGVVLFHLNMHIYIRGHIVATIGYRYEQILLAAHMITFTFAPISTFLILYFDDAGFWIAFWLDGQFRGTIGRIKTVCCCDDSTLLFQITHTYCKEPLSLAVIIAKNHSHWLSPLTYVGGVCGGHLFSSDPGVWVTWCGVWVSMCVCVYVCVRVCVSDWGCVSECVGE